MQPYLNPFDEWRARRDFLVSYWRRRIAAWIRSKLHPPDDPTTKTED